MADKIKIRRGDFVDLPDLDEAEFGLATDTRTLYIGTAEATNILLNPVLEHGDGYSIDGYLIPLVDNVHNLGTPENRWHSVFVGPGTINIVAKDSDAGYSANQEFRIGVDSATGTLQFVSGSNDLLMVLDPETGVTFPAGGSVDADAGLTNTVTEHYNQQGQINQTILQALDAYGGSTTEEEHYQQQGQINQTILQALDGYATTLDTGATGDGYLAFYTGVGRSLAGDNDLFWDRINSRLGIGTALPNSTLDVRGVATFIGDTGVGGHTFIASGANVNNRRGILVEHRTTGVMTDGFGVRIQLSNRDSDGISNVIAELGTSRTGSDDSGDLLFLTASSGALEERLRIGANGNSTVSGDLTIAGAIHNQDLAEAFQVIRQATDGYQTQINALSPDITFQEFKVEQSQINQSIIQSLDGYLTTSSGITATQSFDGYIAFFTGSSTIAGDNDLFWNRVDNQLNVDGYILPTTDNAHDLGSPTKRWHDIWLGPGSLQFRQNSGENDTGVERNWNMSINSAGNLTVRQSTDTWLTFGRTTQGANAVGIGTSLPNASFEVAGQIRSTAAEAGVCFLANNLADTNSFIGGTSSGTSSSLNYRYDATFQSISDVYRIRLGGSATPGAWMVGIGDAAPVITVRSNNSNVGIGTSAPNASFKLQISNSAQYTVAVENTAVANSLWGFRVDASGNLILNGVNVNRNFGIATAAENTRFIFDTTNTRLGIGVASPVFALDVAGDANIAGSIVNRDLTEAFQVIRQAADGYVSAPNLSSIGDGYVAFFIDGGRQVAGDNDLFYDRLPGVLKVFGGSSEVQVGDVNFGLDFATDNTTPRITFDSGDRMRFARSSDGFFIDIASTTAFSITSTAASINRTFRPSADNTYDLGAQSVLEWRHGFFTGSIVAQTGLAVGFAATPVADEIHLGDTTFKLDFDAGGAGVPGLAFDANDYISYNRASDYYSFNINNSEKMRLTTDGYLGIGGTPNDLFEVRGFNQTEGHVRVSIGESNLYTSGIEFYTGTTERRGFVGWRGTESGSSLDNTGMYLVNFDNSPLYLGTNGVERMQITGIDGYVGVNGTPQLVGGVGPGRLHVFTTNAGESIIAARDMVNTVGFEIVSPSPTNIFLRGGGGDNLHLSSNSSGVPAITIDATNIVSLPGFNAYASVTILTDSTASISQVNPFRDAYHAAFVENTNWRHNAAPVNVTYSPTTGQFIVGRSGTYSVEINAVLLSAATGVMDTIAVRLNGATDVWVAQPTVHSSVDPAILSIMFYIDLDATNYLELWVDGNLATNITAENGTTFNIRRIG